MPSADAERGRKSWLGDAQTDPCAFTEGQLNSHPFPRSVLELNCHGMTYASRYVLH